MEKPAMRQAYADALCEMAADESVVVLDADLANATTAGAFKKLCPERFFDMGIAEQNLMGAAAGMACCGLKPFASTFALFGTGRAYEVIRNAVCYAKAPVRIVGTHAGLSANADGGSHEAVEDMALMRVLPGMMVLSPCDYEQARDMILQMKDMEHPVYIRLSRHPVKEVVKSGYPTEIGRIQILKEGTDLCIAATGIMVAEALEAACALEKRGIRASVLNVHTIKPLDEETLIQAATCCKKRVLTVEEHSVIGGLGSAVCEALSNEGGFTIRRMGIQDQFGQSGDLDELMDAYGLTAGHIEQEAFEMINK